MMCSVGESGEIIILSDDDDDDNRDSDNDISCLIVEVKDEKKADCVSSPSTSNLDEDLVVTFARRADLLPHARYDCPLHPFTASECEIMVPVADNRLICDQCFCYICDKLASSCAMWCISGACHCNSHKKSDFWNNLRNCLLLGELKTFNITLTEIDSHLRRAETMLQSFRQELSALYAYFVLGEAQVQDGNQQGLVHNYTPVFEFISSFLNKADKQDSRAAAILNLGAAREFIKHFQVSGPTRPCPVGDVSEAKLVLLGRVITSVQKQIVFANFGTEFIQKLQDFYQNRIYLPSEMKAMKNSLCVRPWDDVLLVSVLKGQNVSGVRKDKGKKDILNEQISVVLLRSELLQHQRRYRELCRYLRVVQTDDAKLFQQLQDLIPFFLCMEGNFAQALTSLFPAVNAPASRFTAQIFLFYLRIFKTATVPKLIVSQPEQLCHPDTSWEPVKDAVPIKHTELVKFALRAQKCSPTVYANSQCWIGILTILNSPCDSLAALPEPSPQFLLEARGVVTTLLVSQQGSSMQIPRSLCEVYPDQALLLLVTGALVFRILSGPLSPALPVLNTFKDNLWAYKWLVDTMAPSVERLKSFSLEITQEMVNTAGIAPDFKLDSFQTNGPSDST
ncbi:uncharacterized protein ACNS7B_007876 [Menidia menidia]